MNDENYKLTTVKVLSENYTKFKVNALSTNITLQKLVNRAIDKYLSDEDFQKIIDEAELIKDNNKF
jgi:ABC-type amino acid transport substrate-binding protein